jgi:hypothetical protein
MIILLAMVNSLAAHENAQREPTRPSDRAAWGVYAGDGKIWKWGGRRRVMKLARRTRFEAKHPRRPNGGRRVVVLPSGHRQPEIETSLATPPLNGAARRRSHDFDPSRSVGSCPAGQLLPSACNRPARMLAGYPNWQAIRRVDNPPRPLRATRRPSQDGPGSMPRSTNERASCANSVRIRNALQIGAFTRVGKFFSHM